MSILTHSYESNLSASSDCYFFLHRASAKRVRYSFGDENFDDDEEGGGPTHNRPSDEDEEEGDSASSASGEDSDSDGDEDADSEGDGVIGRNSSSGAGKLPPNRTKGGGDRQEKSGGGAAAVGAVGKVVVFIGCTCVMLYVYHR